MIDPTGPDLIRKLRAETGMSQGKVARAAGVTKAAISQIENLRFTPRRDTVAQIGAVLGARNKLLSAFGYPITSPGDDDVIHRVDRLERLVLGLASRLRESLEADEELLELVADLETERAVRQPATR